MAFLLSLSAAGRHVTSPSRIDLAGIVLLLLQGALERGLGPAKWRR
jgi:hypothetical protein